MAHNGTQPTVNVLRMNQVIRTGVPRTNDGTWVIALGAIVASLGAYAFQVVGGRSLGADGFAPVATVWTIGFLVYTIAMLPVEQMTTRTVTLRAGEALDGYTRRQIAITLGGGTVLGVIVAALGIDRFFSGSASFVAAIALLLFARALTAVARGVMTGRRRFTAYGLTMMLESFALVGLGIVFALADVGALWFALSLGAAPLTLLLVRPYLVRTDPGRTATDVPATAGLLQLLVVAAALSQLILAGGPLVVGLIGGTAAEVSIYFITFTLLRGPITASYPLGTRFLAAMTTALSEDRPEVLHTWAARLAGLGGTAALLAGFVSYHILPAIIELLYGSEFRPSAIVGGLGGAGAVAALAVLFVTQIVIARGRTRDLVIGWMIAAVVAVIILAVSGADPLTRVAYAFAAGELTAFAVISLTAYRRSAS
jgi:O-antigen/teichoic acid export membrane protein